MANFNIDYLVVAGGGSGGSTGDNIGAGGGGAGGFITSWSGGSGGGQVSQPTLTKSTQVPYTVTVGSGGIAPTAYYDGNGTGGGRGLNGTASIFDSVSATGGGGGGGGGSGNLQIAGGDGGSGGGGASYYTGGKGNNIGSPVQGFDGGTASGITAGNRIAAGGGGAGSAGKNGGTSTSGTIGQGGSGMSYASGSASITNLSATYAGGGGGGTGTGTQSVAGGNDGGGDGGAWKGTSNPAATNGANTGSGGGGGAGWGGQGGNGGSGVVILRYTTSDANYTTTGITPTETTIGGETILSFTTVGTGAITFTTPTPPFSGTKVTNPVTGFNSTTEEGLKLPSGNNASQPTGVQGMIRNNTGENTGGSASAIEHHNGTNWQYFAATESPDVVYPTSLKMYLDASDTTSYPGTGTTWFDLTSNANNGIISGATFLPSNASFDFDGSNDYISFSQFNISSNNKVTVELWTNPDSSQVDYANMFDYGHDGTNGFTVQQNASSTNNYYVYNTGVLGTNSIPANTWTQFCFTGDGTNWKIYKNGALVSTVTSSVSANTTGRTLNIGRWLGGTARYWNGQISKVRIYDTHLSGIEVTALYNEGR